MLYTQARTGPPHSGRGHHALGKGRVSSLLAFSAAETVNFSQTTRACAAPLSFMCSYGLLRRKQCQMSIPLSRISIKSNNNLKPIASRSTKTKNQKTKKTLKMGARGLPWWRSG